jgi:hypothetical protein
MLWYLSTPLYPVDNETLPANLAGNVAVQRALLQAGIRTVSPQVGFCLMVTQPEPREWNFSLTVALDVLSRCDGLILAGNRLSSTMETERDVAAMGGLKVLDLILLDLVAVVEAVNVTECLAEMEENTTEVLT